MVIFSTIIDSRGLGLAALGGAVYAVGGLDDKLCFDIVERYDPSSNNWTQVASMTLPRGGVGVAALRVGWSWIMSSFLIARNIFHALHVPIPRGFKKRQLYFAVNSYGYSTLIN